MINLLRPVLFIFLVSISLYAQSGISSDLSRRLEKHVSILAADSMQGRGVGTEGTKLAMNYIADQFRGAGLEPYDGESYLQKFDFRLDPVRIPGVNIVGLLRGNDPAFRNEYIVIGAHYDHLGYKLPSDKMVFPIVSTTNDSAVTIYRGADDNASGVAAVIELARFFSDNTGLVKRSIVFIAFDAEESGLHGSNKFLSGNKIVKHSDIRLMFSLDMIGMYSENEGLILEGIGSAEGGMKIARDASAVSGVIIKKMTPNIEPQTDTWPFGNKGIPSVHAFTGTISPYHKPEDTYEKLDFEGMAKVTAFLSQVISTFSSQAAINPSKDFINWLNPGNISANIGLFAGFGNSNHLYPDEYFNAKNIFGFNTGVFAHIKFGRRIAFQPAVLFSTDGSETPNGTLRRYSVSAAFDVHYNLLNEMGGLIKVFPFAGGYFLYSLGGKDGGIKLDFDNVFNRKEWGLSLGVGAELMKVQIKYSWQRGLTKLTKTGNVSNYNSGSYLTLGYIF